MTRRFENYLYFAIVAVTHVLLNNIAITVGDTTGDAMDTRESMVIEANNAITEAYYTIAADGLGASICEGVTNYEFPDICMPDDEYRGEWKRTKNDETETVTYDDDRPRDGKNTPKDLETNEKFGNIRTGDYLGYKIQPKTPQNQKVHQEICAAKNVGGTFARHAKGDSKYGELAATTSWQYFGGQETGLFAQYPASIKTKCWCNDYDPRYRPWYAAAVTGPKDIILVLDASASMREEVSIKNTNGDGEAEERRVKRLDIMKDAAIAQLDTVTFSDFIQVVVYSTSAKSSGNLIRGTSENKKKLIDYIKEIKAAGSTCGKCGIEKAFSIFKASQNSQLGEGQNSAGCERIISFLTDGEMNDRDWKKDWASWMEGQKQALTGPSPHIFTYALGKGAHEEIPAKLACENRGWYAKIDDGDPAALKHAMIRYFEYFANKIPIGNATIIPRWTEFYQDASGQGKMTTVALPVYVKQASGRRVFHGVVGIDVLATDFGSSLEDSALAVKLQKRSSQCVNYDFNVTEFTPQLVVPKFSSEKCQIQPIKNPEPHISTGATMHNVGGCENIVWWGVLLIILGCLCPVGCCVAWCAISSRQKKKTSNVHQAKTVQMVRTSNNGMQHQNQMLNNNHSNMAMLQQHRNSIIMQQQQQQHNNMMMQQQQYRNGVMLQQQQPGMMQPGMLQHQQPGMMQPGMLQQQQPGMMQPGMMQPGMAPTMQNQFMMNQPQIMMNQNGGAQQQPIVVQAQAIQQQSGRQTQ